MAPDVSSHLATASGMPDVNGVLETELLRQLRQIVRVRIEVVAVPRLARSTVAPPIMGNLMLSSILASATGFTSTKVGLNVNNVFDRRHYQTIGSINGGNWYGEPRNFLLRLDGQF